MKRATLLLLQLWEVHGDGITALSLQFAMGNLMDIFLDLKDYKNNILVNSLQQKSCIEVPSNLLNLQSRERFVLLRDSSIVSYVKQLFVSSWESRMSAFFLRSSHDCYLIARKCSKNHAYRAILVKRFRRMAQETDNFSRDYSK